MSRNTATVPKQPNPKRTTSSRRLSPSVPGFDRPCTTATTRSVDRKSASQEALPLKPSHKLGKIPEYLRKGSKPVERATKSGEGDQNRNVWEEKCQALEEKIVWYEQQFDVQRKLIASLQERVAQLETVVQAIPAELKRLCSEIDTREKKIQGLERSLADSNASKLDLLHEELRGLRQLVQQPADVFQYYGHQLNRTVDMLAQSYHQLLSVAENQRTMVQLDEHSDQEDEPHRRNFYRQKMRLDKRNRHTQIRVKKYDG